MISKYSRQNRLGKMIINAYVEECFYLEVRKAIGNIKSID